MATRDTALATEDWTGFSDGDQIESSANWQDINDGSFGSILVETSGSGPLIIGSSGNSTLANNPQAVWTGSGSFDNDQWVEFTIVTSFQSAAFQSGGSVRTSTDVDTNRDGYFLVVKHDGFIQQTTVLCKIVNGTLTELVNDTANINWANNDTGSLEVVGSSLTAFRNGVVLSGFDSITDSDLTTGNPGVWAGGARTAGDTGITDWEAGNFVSGSSGTGLSQQNVYGMNVMNGGFR